MPLSRLLYETPASEEPPPSPPSPSLARSAALVGMLGAFIVLAAVASISYLQWRDLTENMRSSTASSAFFLADHGARLFEVSDLALRKAADALGERDWDEIEASRPLFDELTELRADLPYVDELWVNDSTGELRLTTFGFPAPQANLSDRDVFQAHQAQDAGLFVGQPIIGRVTDRPTFLVSRRLGGNEFKGIVSASLALDYFNTFWKRIPLPPDARIALFRKSDQAVLARFPQAPAEAAPVPFNAALEEMIAENPEEGSYTNLAQEKDVRFGSYHQVGNLPLYVRVSVPRQALFSLWLEQAQPNAFFALAAILSLIALTAFARHQARREDESRAFLKDEVARQTVALREETQALEALNGASRILSAELDPGRAIRTIVQASVVMSGARAGAFLPADQKRAERSESDRIVVRNEDFRPGFLRFVSEHRGELLRSGHNILRVDETGEWTQEREASGVGSFLAVPIISRSGEVHGELFLAHSNPHAFGARAERLSVGLAAQAAIAIDNANLFEAAQKEIVARKETQVKQELLIRELHHRVKNTLAVVQAIAGMTARSAEDMSAFNDAFAGRLSSLASTHTLLTEWAWQKVPLGDLIRGQLEPYPERVHLDGPNLELAAAQAVPIGMAIHELATNAIKYGGLSKAEGRLSVVWRVEEDKSGDTPGTLFLEWRESGGPPAVSPTRRGFGSRLLSDVLRVQLRARTEIRFEPEGLVFELEVPIAPIVVSDYPGSAVEESAQA
ncbi:GAF domain-containing protein [Afifella sp. H1R]|uniref:sensor histidine kinase n=1 Tax=Afifella sp. H1R TaxID=2908841 RepID=UPI001F16ABDE|nr:GAF domain-containing protein [Afifella sp. H1R]